MPRYLAIDYYAKALEERQNDLYRMLLAVPHHLECIDNYAHKGKKDDRTYNVPWKKEFQDKLVRKTPQEDLSSITSNLSKQERFSVAPSQDEFIPSSNPDSPPINFDVWSDLEVEVVNYLVESLQSNDVEDFVEDTWSSQDEKLLEEQSSVDHLSEFRFKLPGVASLCSRLRPKVVQDPFSDKSGETISEHSIVYGSDKVFALSAEEKLKRNQSFRETFMLHQVDAHESDDKLDMTLELPRSPDNILNRRRTSSRLPSKTQVDLENCATDDLKTTVKEELSDITSGSKKKLLEQPQFKLEDKTRNKNTDFVTMNVQGTSEINNSQSISEKKLESPIINGRESSASTTPKQKLPCQDLSSMNISPVTTSSAQVISPCSKEELTDKIWQNERVFNDILVKILPVPRIKTDKTNKTTAIPQKLLQKEVIKGDLELQLPWDPLTNTTCLASIHNKLNKVELFPHKKKKEKKTMMAKETFEKITWEDKSIESPGNTSFETSNKPTSISTSSTTITSKKVYPIEENANFVAKKTQPTDENRTQQPNSAFPKAPLMGGNSLKRSPWTPQSLEDTFSCLDDFLLLRSMKKTENGTPSNSYGPPKTIVKAAKVRPSVSTPVNTNTNQDPMQSKPATKQTIPVEISTEYQEVIDFLSSSIHPFLARSKEKGAINQDRDIMTLTPDYTRFTVKQVQMIIHSADEDTQLTYKLAVCLHVLVGALELVVHFGMGVALAHLSHSQEKYADILGNALDSIRRHLFNAHVKFQQNSVLHPKIVTILNTIRQWMVKHTRNKVLIVSYRHTDYLYRQLKDILVSFGGIQVSLYDSQDALAQSSIDSSDVVIISSDALNQDLPWDLFSHVIEFESKTNSNITSYSDQVEYIVLVMRYGVKETPVEDAVVRKNIQPSQQQTSPSQYIFIGSTNITSNVKLLHLLEGRHNIMIYERDYSCLYKSKDSKMNLQPHLMIDERTCVIIEKIANLDQQDEYDKLRDLVVSLSLKCIKCYIILFCETEDLKRSTITDGISNHLSMLFANVAYFKHSNSDFQMEILYCNTMEEVAIWIRRIGDQAKQTSKVWEQHEWVKRKWLTDEMTRHERFLLSFPCMNSFSAQVMLTAAALPRLLTMSLSELMSTCPWIPQQILNMLYQTTHLAESVTSDIHNVPPRDATPTGEPYIPTLEQQPHRKDYSSTNMASFNTPKSYASDDSLWLAMQDEKNIDYLSDVVDREDLADSKKRNSLDTMLHDNQKFKGQFNSQSSRNQLLDFQRNADNDSSSYNPEQTAGRESLNRSHGSQLLDRPQNVVRVASQTTKEWDREKSDENDILHRSYDHDLHEHVGRVATNTTESLYREKSAGDHCYRYQSGHQALKQPIKAPENIDREWTKSSGEWYQINDDDSRNIHRHHAYNQRENGNTAPKERNRALQAGNDVSGYRYTEIDTSMENHPTTSKHPRREYSDYLSDNHTHQEIYQPSLQYEQPSRLGRDILPRDKLKYKTLSYSSMIRNPDRSNGGTNVGVAQPVRRTQLCKDPRNDERTTTLQEHHRQTSTKTRKVMKEHVVPYFEPSPDEYFNDLSIFTKWSDGHNKKQRLSYERIPGAKGGQTKLIFN